MGSGTFEAAACTLIQEDIADWLWRKRESNNSSKISNSICNANGKWVMRIAKIKLTILVKNWIRGPPTTTSTTTSTRVAVCELCALLYVWTGSTCIACDWVSTLVGHGPGHKACAANDVVFREKTSCASRVHRRATAKMKRTHTHMKRYHWAIWRLTRAAVLPLRPFRGEVGGHLNVQSRRWPRVVLAPVGRLLLCRVHL